MREYLVEAPLSWKRPLVLAAVSKNGTPYDESFQLACDRPISYWGQLYTALGALDAHVGACRSEGRIVVTTELSARVSVPCSRCLEPAETSVTGKLRYIFSLRHEEEARETDAKGRDGDEEMIILNSWEDEIDLAPMLWETLITALPGTVLCKEDCKGLCPQCGANLNKGQCGCKEDKGDPRFQVLRKFMSESGK